MFFINRSLKCFQHKSMNLVLVTTKGTMVLVGFITACKSQFSVQNSCQKAQEPWAHDTG